LRRNQLVVARTAMITRTIDRYLMAFMQLSI
jgi:hypothetical protein